MNYLNPFCAWKSTFLTKPSQYSRLCHFSEEQLSLGFELLNFCHLSFTVPKGKNSVLISVYLHLGLISLRIQHGFLHKAHTQQLLIDWSICSLTDIRNTVLFVPYGSQSSVHTKNIILCYFLIAHTWKKCCLRRSCLWSQDGIGHQCLRGNMFYAIKWDSKYIDIMTTNIAIWQWHFLLTDREVD